MFSVRMRDFRNFHDTNYVDLRRITLLVGENSAGKTSFLAGCRYLFESFSRQEGASFNRSPYFLGGFQQIAHYRGGRGGRAKEFSLSIKHRELISSEFRKDKKTEDQEIIHEFSFDNGDPQPNLSKYKMLSGGVQLECVLKKKEPEIFLSMDNGSDKIFAFEIKNGPPSELVRNNPRYITYLVEEVGFSDFKRKGVEEETLHHLEREGFTDGFRRQLSDLFQKSARTFSRSVFATAPVRTQPSRTYNPSEMAASAEGSHVPLEMARIKQRSPEQWDEIRKSLSAFGKNSGMFTDIDIRQLGKSDIDPFQLLVKVDGPARNLMDVGYGVSQILPIIYQIQTAARNQIFLLQQPEVHLHPRAQAELGSLFARSARAGRTNTSRQLFVVETHSDYIIDRIRMEIASSRLKKDDVTILFFDRNLKGSSVRNINLDDGGELINPPENFRKFFLEEQARMLGM